MSAIAVRSQYFEQMGRTFFLFLHEPNTARRLCLGTPENIIIFYIREIFNTPGLELLSMILRLFRTPPM